MFCVGDKVAHPMHGAGIIDAIVTEVIAGMKRDYYVFRMPVGGLTLKIPTAGSEVSGLRSVWEHSRLKQLLHDMSALEVDCLTGSWNQRYRENMERLKSGDLYEVARVIKGLLHRESVRGLSTGERKMLRTAKQILISEIALTTGETYDDLDHQVNQAAAGGAEG